MCGCTLPRVRLVPYAATQPRVRLNSYLVAAGLVCRWHCTVGTLERLYIVCSCTHCHDFPVVIVVEEHNQLHIVDVKGHIDQGDEDLNADDDFLKDLDFTCINNDDIPSCLDLNLDDDDFGLLSGLDDCHLKKVNEFFQPATKTGDDVNALKIMLSSSKPMEDSSRIRDVVSWIPPLDTNFSTSVPFLSEMTQPQTSLPSPRQGVFIQSQAPPVSSIVTTTIVTILHRIPIFSDYEKETFVPWLVTKSFAKQKSWRLLPRNSLGWSPQSSMENYGWDPCMGKSDLKLFEKPGE
ncbi:unnamed protein product [Lactuca saligna]|uniref:Uncharacterized protein n=1 Tax=Lactuca saligna TaxID=75948 RepID=A0AA35V1V1_LACSI|nr:unnamed protein product [Lactuca saligna]